MSAKTMLDRECLAILQSEYENAWRCFAREVEALQAMLRECETQNRQPDAAELASARKSVESATAAYRETRNQLAAFLLERGEVFIPGFEQNSAVAAYCR